jgi:hypothetical protein
MTDRDINLILEAIRFSEEYGYNRWLDAQGELIELLERFKKYETVLQRLASDKCSPPPKYPPCGYTHPDGRVQPYTHPGCIARKALE